MMLWAKYRSGIAGGSGVFIDERIQTNIDVLLDLTDKLYHLNYELVSYNTEGIIYTDMLDPITISPDKKEFDMLKNSIVDINNYVTTNKINIFELEKLLSELRDKTDNVYSNLENYKGEEITNEFFILFDFLPEHIKKELKIYIKK